MRDGDGGSGVKPRRPGRLLWRGGDGEGSESRGVGSEYDRTGCGWVRNCFTTMCTLAVSPRTGRGVGGRLAFAVWRRVTAARPAPRTGTPHGRPRSRRRADRLNGALLNRAVLKGGKNKVFQNCSFAKRPRVAHIFNR